MTVIAPVQVPIFPGQQQLPEPWLRFFQQVAAAANAALAAASAEEAVLNDRRVNAGAGLAGGGNLGADVAVRFYVDMNVVANLPATATPGAWCFATNGRKSGEGAGAGTGVPVCWDGSHWIAPWSSAAVTA